MGNFETDLKKRDLLIFAFYERKQYRDNWISRIEAELTEQGKNPDPEKSTKKMEKGLQVWKNLHQVIERYPDENSEWGKLGLPELWKIVTDDRELSDVIYNGILQLKGHIVQNRGAEGLPVLCADMSNLAYGRDSKDYQEWALLNELKDGLHEAFRQDQQQSAAPEQRDFVAFEILKKMHDSASEQDQEEYFRSRQGRHKKGVQDQDIYFEPALRQFNKANKGGLEMSTFLKIVGRFKNSLTD